MRGSGILMHITSLPGPYGVGTMGAQAYAFVDFLNKAGQNYWQILPLTPTSFGDSPYQSCSTFAGNHYLIDLDALVQEGLLQKEFLEQITWCRREDQADFGLLYQSRLMVLREAYSHFTDNEALDAFCHENSMWLSDYALYMALKDRFGGAPWYLWDAPLKTRQADALWNARQQLGEEIRFYCFVQYLFYKQWTNLKNYAHDKGVVIIGDVPIYVPMDSVDVWSNPELFLLDETLTPVAVAGCPPDAFSEDGQLWGNPLYRWDVMEKDGYGWWIRRLAAAGNLYDIVRIDHFRGFEAYWQVPYGQPTAKDGQWVKGPGLTFVEKVKEALPQVNFIAEDLGYLTQEVLDLRDQSGFPGMKVLEFAFDSQEPSEYLPHTYIQNTVCYIGTHDNMTTRQWLETAPEATVQYATEYMHLTKEEGYVWGVIRTAMQSVSDLCIIQLQDYLELGGEARMNFPGTTGTNWLWRAEDGCYSDALAEKIRYITRLYGRLQNS